MTINGGSGDDSIYNSTSSEYSVNNSYGYVTIDAGAGNDTVYSNDPYTSINGGAGNDSIRTGNWLHVTVRGGAGNDTISGSSKGTWYQYANGDGNDIITNYNSNDTVQITSGTVTGTVLSGSDLLIAVGSGTITLKDAGNKSLNLVNASKGKITLDNDPDSPKVISNTNKNSLVSGSSKADTIKNSAGGVTIRGGAGNDSIRNSTSSSYTINNSYGYVTIDAGNGNDTVYNNDPYVSINGGAGNDSVYTGSYSDYVTVRGGTGNDTLSGNGSMRLIQYASGDGNDLIVGYGNTDIIQILGGNVDSTQLSGTNVIVNVGAGKITLQNASDKNLNLVDAYNNKITIGGSTTTVSTIYNTTRNTIVSGTSDKDTISNSAGGVTIRGGAGNDSIYNSTSGNYTVNNSYGYVTIDGGDGNDTIESHDPYMSINGGAGNDSINAGSWNDVTIKGGKGNDYICFNGAENIIQYASGDGNDTIVGYNSDSTIRITDRAAYSTRVDGSDVIVSIGAGSMRLKNAVGKTLNIVGSSINTIETALSIVNTIKNTLVSGSSGNDSLRNRAGGVTIRGGAGDDSIYNSTSPSYTINNSYGYVTIDAGDGNDTVYSYDPRVSINAGDGNDSMYAGSYSYVTVRGGAGNDTVRGLGSYNVLEYANGDGLDVVYGFTANSTLRILDESTYSTLKSGSDVIVYIGDGAVTLKEYYSSTLNIIGGTNTLADESIANYEMNTVFSGTDRNDKMKNYAGGVTIQAGAGNDSIYNSTSSEYTVNNSYGYVTIDAGAGSDTINSNDPRMSINGGNGNDSININSWYSVTVRGGAGNDTITNVGSGNVIEYASGDGNDVIFGFDRYDTILLTDGSSFTTAKSGDDLIIKVGSGKMTLNKAIDINVNIINDSETVEPGPRDIHNYKSNTIISGTNYNDTLENTGDNVTVNAGSGDDTVDNYFGDYAIIDGGDGDDYINNYFGDYALINGGDGDDTIINNGEFATIDSGSGDDSIDTYESEIKIYSGNGNDSIGIYAHDETIDAGDGDDYIYIEQCVGILLDAGSGDDYIYDTGFENTIHGGAGNDTIYWDFYPDGNVVQYASGDGNDIIYGYYHDSTIQIIDGADYSTLAIGDDVIIKVDSGSMTLKDAYGFQINIAGGNLVTEASYINNTTNNVKVLGTNGDDSITNTGKNVTIEAGTGDDTITGSSNAEVYLFGEFDGNDLITNFGVKDTLKVTDGELASVKVSGSNYIVTVEGEALSSVVTLKGAASNVLKVNGTSAVLTSGKRTVNTKNNVKLTGSSYADSIISNGSKVTIQAGKGNDTITGSSNAEVILVSYASGKDIVTNFGVKDTLRSTSGTLKSKVSGSNYIVTVSGDDTSAIVTLKGAASNVS